MPLKHPSPESRILLLVLALTTLSGCAAVAVVAGANAVHDRRSVGTLLDDEGIELRTNDVLYRDGGPGNGHHVRVVSYNRLVLLVGEAGTEAARSEIVTAAETVPDVRRVVNEIAVMTPRGIGRRSRDTLLTGQIKASLLGVDVPGFAPQRVKVVSVRGIAYLMGLLTPTEAERVSERVARVSGVREVITVFDYLPEDGGSEIRANPEAAASEG